jgi:hypothetical protein
VTAKAVNFSHEGKEAFFLRYLESNPLFSPEAFTHSLHLLFESSDIPISMHTREKLLLWIIERERRSKSTEFFNALVMSNRINERDWLQILAGPVTKQIFQRFIDHVSTQFQNNEIPDTGYGSARIDKGLDSFILHYQFVYLVMFHREFHSPSITYRFPIVSDS